MVSLRYLLNSWMDFDQTCIDTLLGGGEESWERIAEQKDSLPTSEFGKNLGRG